MVEQALGHGRKEPAASEANTAAIARKSLVVARDLARGTKLRGEDIAIKRPGTGLQPVLYSEVVGRVIKQDVSADTLLSRDMLE